MLFSGVIGPGKSFQTLVPVSLKFEEAFYLCQPAESIQSITGASPLKNLKLLLNHSSNDAGSLHDFPFIVKDL